MAGDEYVDWIDAEGRVRGVVSRREMRTRRLLHRCVYILTFNRRGELFLHLRTATKDVYPSHYDVAVGGVLLAGESFPDGASREVREELGIDAAPTPLFSMCYEDARTAVQGEVYRLVHDGPFRLQPEEIVRGEFVPVPRALARTAVEPFCPDGIQVLRQYLALPSER